MNSADYNIKDFLPVNRETLEARGWKELDFLIVSGDAYVDHPSFAAAVIGRLLENNGYRTGILAQPEWRDREKCERDFFSMGRPALAALVSAGNLDSMVAHYTASKKRRSTDVYSPGGRTGRRPDRATIVYSKILRELFPGLPVIIGGLEASMRRFAHYDYWDGRVRPSILDECLADILVYGMGERQILEIASRLAAGWPVDAINDVSGTAFIVDEKKYREMFEGRNTIKIFSWKEVAEDKKKFAEAFMLWRAEADHIRGKIVVQEQRPGRFLIVNPPARPLERAELDRVYALPFTRRAHPFYDKEGGVPALLEVKFSVTSSRGCFGGCSFCSLSLHQGRVVTSRSHESIIHEVENFVKDPEFKGYVHDVGGPAANFRSAACEKQLKYGTCVDRECLGISRCKNLKVSHRDYLDLLRKLRAIPGVKKVFIRSGIRFDYLLLDPDDTFFRELVRFHVSGHLKVAPEHCSRHVLALMNKPPAEVFKLFVKRFYELSKEYGLEQYLVPYFISAHPGATLEDAIDLALFMKETGCMPEQVQEFYPLPGTLSTTMYHTGLDPRTMQGVYVAKTAGERAMQRALLQFSRPENRSLVLKALKLAGREELIGYGRECLVKPEPRVPGRKR